MAGILNNKERIMDLLVTAEGRRQAAAAQFNVRYYSFTDYATFYEASGSLGVADDASNRIFFEASNRHQDVIVPELEFGTDSVTRPFKINDFVIDGKTVASGTFRSGSVLDYGEIYSSGDLPENIGRVLEGITTNFSDCRLISNVDHFRPARNFESDRSLTGSFGISRHAGLHPNDTTYNKGYHIDVDQEPSLFQDQKTSHLPNFLYLPPVNAGNNNDSPGTPLGNYARLDQERILTIDDLNSYLADKPYEEINFRNTTIDNNMLAQVFEVGSSQIQKLAIIDFGSFPGQDQNDKDKHVYFIGKMKRDNGGSDTFVNMFTMVFE